MIHYKVTLTDSERDELKLIMNKGNHSSQQFRNACILLNCDASETGQQPFTNEQVSKMLQVNTKTVERLKQRFEKRVLEPAWIESLIREQRS